MAAIARHMAWLTILCVVFSLHVALCRGDRPNPQSCRQSDQMASYPNTVLVEVVEHRKRLAALKKLAQFWHQMLNTTHQCCQQQMRDLAWRQSFEGLQRRRGPLLHLLRTVNRLFAQRRAVCLNPSPSHLRAGWKCNVESKLS